MNFSEPLSMLQRLTEDFEYASILDTAAELTDQYEKLAYVAAFTISMYSTTVNRTSKPFNPLLGETFECDRTEDLGWRAVNEQVFRVSLQFKKKKKSIYIFDVKLLLLTNYFYLRMTIN